MRIVFKKTNKEPYLKMVKEGIELGLSKDIIIRLQRDTKVTIELDGKAKIKG